MSILKLSLAAAASLALAAQSLGAEDPESGRDADARDYRNCINLSTRAPQAAHDVAGEWLDKGGGIPAQHCRALSLASLGRYGEAARALEAAAEDLRIAEMNNAYTGFFRRGKGLVGELLGQAGNAWLLAGDAVQAYTAFSQGLTEVAPGSLPAVQLTIDRARASGVAGDYIVALEDLDRAVEWLAEGSAGRVEVLVLRASAYRNLERLEEAASDLERAFELVADDREALLERGNLSLMTGAVTAAEADWRRIMELYPESPAAISAERNLARLAAENLEQNSGPAKDD